MRKILTLMNSFNVGGVTNVAIAIYDGLDKEKYSVDFIRNGQYAENDIEKTVKENGQITDAPHSAAERDENKIYDC